MNEDLIREHTKAIRMLEMLAHSTQGLLGVVTKGVMRDRAVKRLAHVDQCIAERKERVGIVGSPDCTYLNG